MIINLIGFVGLLVAFCLALFAWSMIITIFFGPPTVPTPKKIIKEILATINPKKGDFLIDLGSGSGRVVRIAAKYGIRGLGIEINPFLVLWSRFRARISSLNNIEFKRENFLKTDLSKADIIFMYMLPKFLPAVKKKIEKECHGGTLVISQRFAVNSWDKFLFKEIIRNNNSTFIYQVM